jgi:hypothetical protein
MENYQVLGGGYMVYPVIFKDHCSCGGKLYFRTADNEYVEKYDGATEIICMTCKSCRKNYDVSWPLKSGDPSPILDRNGALEHFKSIYDN